MAIRRQYHTWRFPPSKGFFESVYFTDVNGAKYPLSLWLKEETILLKRGIWCDIYENISRATQFIVYDSLPIVTGDMKGFMKFNVSNTEYFKEGLPISGCRETENDSFDVYILPGQDYRWRICSDRDMDMKDDIVIVIPYMLYDGRDAMICNIFLERGWTPITAKRIDDYRAGIVALEALEEWAEVEYVENDTVEEEIDDEYRDLFAKEQPINTEPESETGIYLRRKENVEKDKDIEDSA